MGQEKVQRLRTLSFRLTDKRNKVKFTLEQTTKVQRGSRCILYSFFKLGARWEWMVNTTPLPLYPRKTDLVHTSEEVVWASGAMWVGAENLTSLWIRFPDCPSRSKSLYRLSYPDPFRRAGYRN